MEEPGLTWEVFLEGMSQLRSARALVSSCYIDYRLKPSRQAKTPVSSSSWMKLCTWIKPPQDLKWFGGLKDNMGALALHCTSELAAKLMLSLQAALIFCSLKTVFCFLFSFINLSWMLANKLQGAQFKYSLLSVPNLSWAFWVLGICLKHE